VKVLSRQIDMIATFLSDGVIQPHRFRIEDDGGAQIIQVDKVIQTEETRLAGVKSIVFTCQSAFGDIERRYELKYRIDEHRWELYKM
jgi:NADH:ubiquinone oxidoreductase subunit D